MGVHGDLRMHMLTHDLFGFSTDGAVAECRAFSATGDDSDV